MTKLETRYGTIKKGHGFKRTGQIWRVTDLTAGIITIHNSDGVEIVLHPSELFSDYEPLRTNHG